MIILGMNQREVYGTLSKVKIPPFSGKGDPKQNLDCIDCEDLIKVKLIASYFKGYTLIWWNEIAIQIIGTRKAPIESRDELKREIREICTMFLQKRFLQRMFQGTKNVEEYFKEMERHGKRTYLTTRSNWKGKEKREEKLLKRDKIPKKGSAPFKGHKEEYLGKGHIASEFPNKRKMILRENGDIERSEGEYLSEEAPYERDLLVVQRLMSTFIEDEQFQRENIFHLRCMTQGKCFSLIIDRGSSVNVASQRLVDKLCIPTMPLPKPYKI
ncbi:hypothetical protein CR513_56354, partial [Mucuna pruriens]